MPESPLSRMVIWLTMSAAACGCLAVLADLSAPETSRKYADATSPVLDIPKLPALAELPELSSFTGNEVRPLFSPHRRPVTPPQQIKTVQPPIDALEPDVTLEGVIIGPNSRRACLRSLSDGTSQCLKEGRSIDGWTLTKVYSHSTVLRKGEHKLTLSITRNTD